MTDHKNIFKKFMFWQGTTHLKSALLREDESPSLELSKCLMIFLIVLERVASVLGLTNGVTAGIYSGRPGRHTDVGMNWNNKDHNLLILLFLILFIIQESSDFGVLSVL